MSRSIETTLDIAAPTERVWSALTDFGRFSEWSCFILEIKGELREGTQLEVELDDGGGKMKMRPRLVTAVEGEELRWQGTVGAKFIFSGEHYFQLSPLEDGSTRLTHGEIFSGMLTPLLWKTIDRRTRKAFVEFNDALKARAEALSA